MLDSILDSHGIIQGRRKAEVEAISGARWLALRGPADLVDPQGGWLSIRDGQFCHVKCVHAGDFAAGDLGLRPLARRPGYPPGSAAIGETSTRSADSVLSSPGANSSSSRPDGNGRFRRVSPIAARPGEGLLTEPTPAVRSWSRERVLMPQSRHSPVGRLLTVLFGGT